MLMNFIYNDYAISWVVLLPMATAFLLMAVQAVATSIFNLRGLPGTAWRAVALLATTLSFVLAYTGLWLGFDPLVTHYQLVERVAWIPALGINYFVGIDGISLILVMLTTFLFPVALIGSWNDVVRPLKSYSTFLLLLETGIVGALVSVNVVQLYFFWALTLLASFFLIGRWGSEAGLRAAVKYLLYGLSSFFLLLVATLVVFHLNLVQGGEPNFDLVQMGDATGLAFLATKVPVAGAAGAAWWQTQSALFVAFASAFAITIPLLPFQGWFNDAQAEAPTSGSIIVTALVVKLGAYAFLRVALPLLPIAAHEAVPWLSGLALVGIALSGFLALAEQKVKRLVGYLSLAHMSFIALGIMSLTHHAVVGAVVHMLSHGLGIAALFILFGFLAERRSTQDLSEYGGLAKPMPICAALFALVIFGQVGMPGTSGFVGTFLIVLGSFPSSGVVAGCALAAMVLVAGAMLRAGGGVLLGPLEKAENRGLIDLNLRERLVVLSLVVPVLWIGLYPNPVLRRVEPPVGLLLNTMQRGIDTQPLPAKQAESELLSVDATQAEAKP